MDTGLCYKKCPAGYRSGGPLCIQEDCPAGFRNDPLHCGKPEAYGRGVGYAIWDEGKCKADHGEHGCEMWGAMHYPKCKP